MGRRQRRATSVLHPATPNTAPACLTWTKVRDGGGDTGHAGNTKHVRRFAKGISGAAERSSGAEAAHRHAAEMNLCIDGVQRG